MESEPPVSCRNGPVELVRLAGVDCTGQLHRRNRSEPEIYPDPCSHEILMLSGQMALGLRWLQNRAGPIRQVALSANLQGCVALITHTKLFTLEYNRDTKPTVALVAAAL